MKRPLIAALCLLAGCSSEPDASDFRGVHIGQSMKEINAALGKIGFIAVEQEPGYFDFVNPDAGEVCGCLRAFDDGYQIFFFKPCFFGKPNDTPAAELSSFLTSLTGAKRSYDKLGEVSVTKFGERIRTFSQWVMVSKCCDEKKPGT